MVGDTNETGEGQNSAQVRSRRRGSKHLIYKVIGVEVTNNLFF